MTASGCASGLDHVGIVVHDLAAAEAAWRALGFTVAAGRIMLGQGYLELLADDPARPSTTLSRMLAAGEGAHVLSLRVASAADASGRLARAGFGIEPLASERAADPEQPDGPRARFLRLPLTDADPRLQLIEHLTPDLVWQRRYLSHANGATALAGVSFAAADPAALAARLSRLAGRPVVPWAGGYRLTLAHGAVDVLPGADPARIAGITLRAAASRTVVASGVTMLLSAEG